MSFFRDRPPMRRAWLEDMGTEVVVFLKVFQDYCRVLDCLAEKGGTPKVSGIAGKEPALMSPQVFQDYCRVLDCLAGKGEPRK